MDSTAIKQRLKKEMLDESNMANARLLIEKLQDTCFQSCIQKPSSSLSSSDKACLEHCMNKYMQAWNLVNSAYINKIRQIQSSS
ncbi:hypothetical protein S7711_04331 [Stachybotrys chartarum IBT 7711]|uniref:Mitochondrial import inner membrane translocase subunit n=1 Tax=Stachybotrys chartarum (strain CBS 109288 / IBT 7711) TaxID=1280523 RepID=A0A084AY43_STACB|nr:hypothetical protein S7711_04331 [Stachybotrys chartarum IBT 7711]KFA48157.1 hypothetical protein S40293_06900 [Stachybotrys chartarum IBT 40293]KFA77994.1 hypothetical protein S40288_05235 [Stachybotrys chartarum IBT 40288]